MGDRFWPAYLALLIAGSLGCILAGPDDAVEETEIEGNVGGEGDFVVRGAVATHVGENGYVVTLADTPEVSCDARDGLPSNFRQVRIGAFERTGTYDATALVTFDAFVDGVSEDERASGGTVTIDTIGWGTISGAIDARGAHSAVDGTFLAEVCFF